MKRLGRIRMRILAAILLGVGLSLLIFLNIMSRRSIGQINQSFTSIYNDRLIPATDIFYIMENLYKKRLTMEKFLFSGDSKKDLSYKDIKMYDQSIDSLILLYEKTYLVDNEFKCLNEFKIAISDYSRVENEILLLIQNRSIAEAKHIFESKGSDSFSSLINNLHDLTLIQSSEGEEIIKSSQTMLSDVRISSSLETAVVLLIIIAVQLVMLTTRKLNFPYQKFNLN